MKNNTVHHQIEKKWTHIWEEKGHFQSRVNPAKEPYVIIMPPPNVTGILHMGHVLNNTVQDVLARKARMSGREVCWVPGTDHASIATEAKVLQKLAKKGIGKEDLGKQGFLKEAWQWKEEHAGIIVQQLKRLGISCDWTRNYFTMDEIRSNSVTVAFVKLYEEGHIYRGTRMIHWDPARKTALADEEVIHREVAGKLYYIRYAIEESDEYVTIATTRPETIVGDTAICVHPEDERYKHLHGRKIIVPLAGRSVPMITDAYVDPAFGTGCLKVTPAHDPHDYELGKKHDLDFINIMHPDGSLNEAGGSYSGVDRLEAREQMVDQLAKIGQLAKVVEHQHQVGFSERSNAIVEPRISTQWFVRMEELAKPAIEAVKNGTIQFHPAKCANMYYAWMDNIKEWCISRQLWWGHSIPVYYIANDPDERYVVAATAEEALVKAQELTGNAALTAEDLQQDPDVLDTWFSSWLVPFTAFNGILDPQNEEVTYFYPTHDLVTAPEIIFFWVARMIMAGYYFQQQPPFRHVYFTGIVRDTQRRKMSKSLGNSPDVFALMDRYSVDGVRAGILFSSPAGNDLLFDENLCEQGYQFAHKISNAFKLIQGWEPTEEEPTPLQLLAVKWFQARLQQILRQVKEHFTTFRLSEALIAVYKLIWDNFCAHYLEMMKPQGSKKIAITVYHVTQHFFLDLMKMLHPFMPFITEEIAEQLIDDKQHKANLCIADYPVVTDFDETILAHASKAFALITRLRQYRTKHPWSASQAPTLCWLGDQPAWLPMFVPYIIKATKIATITTEQGEKPLGEAIIMEGTTFWLEGATVTADKTVAVYKKELAYQQQFLAVIEKKLRNERFMANAPAGTIAHEQKKKADAKARIHSLQKLLTQYNS